jgi:hypothetical protein
MPKKYLFLGLLLVSFLIAPLSSSALTTAEQIAQLQQQILVLQAQLRQLQSQSPNPWCHTFNVSFGVGTNNQEAGSLIQALAKEGLLGYNQTTYFSESVAATVSSFQLKYASEILTPLGLTTPTGYVGPSTRRALNRLYGCGIVRPIPVGNQPPVISGVSGPTTRNVGQVGTWTVQASDPENGQLSYSVRWGDEPMIAIGFATPPSTEAVRQTATFTHTYATAGTYYPSFYVTDNSGQFAQTSLSVVVGSGVGGQPLTILSPNGGEVWSRGTTQEIRWGGVDAPCTGGGCIMEHAGNFDIYLSPTIVPQILCPSPGCNWDSLIAKEKSAVNLGGGYRYNWSVGKLAELNESNNAANGNYYIKVCVSNTQNCDKSNQPFRIVGTNQTSPITVTSPNGGEQWVANSTKAITWRYNGATSATKVDLWLQAPMPTCPPSATVCPNYMPAPPITLDKNISALSTYNWIVATDIINNPIASGQYQVYVCPAGSSSPYSTGCDSSDNYFTILGSN